MNRGFTRAGDLGRSTLGTHEKKCRVQTNEEVPMAVAESLGLIGVNSFIGVK
jgi:hypothetical protein